MIKHRPGLNSEAMKKNNQLITGLICLILSVAFYQLAASSFYKFEKLQLAHFMVCWRGWLFLVVSLGFLLLAFIAFRKWFNG